MQNSPIPDKVDPFRLADSSPHLQGIVSIEDLPRLQESLVSTDGVVNVNLNFNRSEEGVFLKGELQGTFVLRCQRCMEPFNYEIMTDFLLGLISEGKRKHNTALVDTIEIADETLDLVTLIEDELLLNLPIVPVHNPEDCKVNLPFESARTQKDDKPESPFKIVELLRFKRDKN